MQAIVAVSENWGIGKDNRLLFHLRADLQRFKALTTGHTVVMGRRTLQSLPGGKGLPGRRNIVLTGDANFSAPEAETVHTLSQLIFTAGADAFVIGGGEVYRQLLPVCDRIYVTRVFSAPPADTFFPDLDADSRWRVAEMSEVMEENGLHFQYVDYVPCEAETDAEEECAGVPAAFAPTEGFSPFSGC